MVIFCGYSHILKNLKNKKNESFSLIENIKKITKIEPYTIELANSKNDYIHDTIINNFYILQNNNYPDSFLNKLQNNEDLSIYPPNEIYYFDYDYYYKNKVLNLYKKLYDKEKFINNYENIQVFIFNQNKNSILHYEVPLFYKLIDIKNNPIELYVLLQGKYDIIFKDLNNKIIHSDTIDF